jgi:hypothetical protein
LLPFCQSIEKSEKEEKKKKKKKNQQTNKQIHFCDKIALKRRLYIISINKKADEKVINERLKAMRVSQMTYT